MSCQSRTLFLQQKERAAFSGLFFSGSAMLVSVSCDTSEQITWTSAEWPAWLDQQLKGCVCLCVYRTAGACSLYVPMRSDRQITRLMQTDAGKKAIKSKQTCTKPQILTINHIQRYRSQQLMVSLTWCFSETTVRSFLEVLRSDHRKRQIRASYAKLILAHFSFQWTNKHRGKTVLPKGCSYWIEFILSINWMKLKWIIYSGMKWMWISFSDQKFRTFGH